eukprot:2369122-Rhodomonas_salina.1
MHASGLVCPPPIVEANRGHCLHCTRSVAPSTVPKRLQTETNSKKARAVRTWRVFEIPRYAETALGAPLKGTFRTHGAGETLKNLRPKVGDACVYILPDNAQSVSAGAI